MSETVLLKKYANRRLYDTEKSAYVTIKQVADIIKKGRQVEVVDAKTHEDVTSFILTQIIMEEAKNKKTLLPVSLLHLIIRYGDNLLGEFFEKYLQQIIKNYLSYKYAVDEQFKNWLDLSMDISGMAQKTITGVSPFNSFMDIFSYPDKQKTKKE